MDQPPPLCNGAFDGMHGTNLRLQRYLKHGRPVAHMNSRAQSCWSSSNKKDDEHVPINQRRRPLIPCVDRVQAQRLPISKKKMIFLLREPGMGSPRLAHNRRRRTRESPEPASVRTPFGIRKIEITCCRGAVQSAWHSTSSEPH